MKPIKIIGWALAATLVGTAALGQGAAPKDPLMPDPKDVPAEKMKPMDPDGTGSTSRNLSEDLRRSEGVIAPPATGNDGGVIRPAPNGSATPVIPPRGRPGDTEQPK